MQKIYEALQQGQDIRQNLIELKRLLKEEGALEEYLEMTEDDALIASFLKDEDPKIRKNAALVLGLLQSQESLEELWEAYQSETQLFVRAAYIHAMQNLDCKTYEQEIKDRYQELLAYDPKEDEQKHLQEELHELQRLAIRLGGTARHRFTGWDQPQDFILTTMKNYQDTTAVQVENGQVKIIPMGVQVLQGDVREAVRLRTYRELLFVIHGNRNLPPDPERMARLLMRSDLLPLLKATHEGDTPFYFRLEIRSDMEQEEKSAFAKKLASELEQRTHRELVNSTEHYEVELRLIQNRKGGFYPCLKLYTVPMKRFSYRKYTTGTSMHPSLAALLVELSSSWQTEHAQVLDAFCGTGTLLTERIYALPVRSAYGVDTFGDAIVGARANAQIARMQINYVQRDILDFTHEYLFDEIWADMPSVGTRTKEEQADFYEAFLDKTGELLSGHGRVFLYSCDSDLVKGYLERHSHLRLRQEFRIREKDGSCLMILEEQGAV